MALPTITTTDFTGVLDISADTYNAAHLQEYIDTYYPYYVRQIVGNATADTVINNAITAKYTALFTGNVYYYNIAKDRTEHINGLVYAIKRFLYFEFTRDYFVETNTGAVRNLNENSTALTPAENNAKAINRWFTGIEELKTNICLFLDNYKDFEGTIDSVTDNGGGSYTINTSSTLYLEDGDTVTIDNAEYVISSLVDNTSFDITASVGQTFGDTYIYDPFEEVVFNSLDYIVF